MYDHVGVYIYTYIDIYIMSIKTEIIMVVLIIGERTDNDDNNDNHCIKRCIYIYTQHPPKDGTVKAY